MLYTYNISPQTVLEDANIVFSTNAIQTGCTATHAVGTGAISLNKPGFYMVSFNADAESAVVGTIQTQMYGNGVLIPSAEASEYSATVNEPVNIGFTALVRVAPNCCSNTNNVPFALTFVNETGTVTYTNVAVTVTKVA